jgi:hypothetical protein
MRSRLEADYAADLDRSSLRWEYESECFANSNGQWLPDFGYTTHRNGPLGVFCEVKPTGPLLAYVPGSVGFVSHVDAFLERMTIAWSSRPDACLELTFWQYGGPAYLTVLCGARGKPWLVEGRQGMPTLLWSGMGQIEKCRDRHLESA